MCKKRLLSMLISAMIMISCIVTPPCLAESVQTFRLEKTTHSSCTDTGTIEYADHTYSFKNSNDVLGTGPILGKNVSDFEWEFDYWSDNPAWRQERFLFHSNSEGIWETDSYCMEIRGPGMGNGPALYRGAASAGELLASYECPTAIGTKTWDGAVYHVKITVKNNICKVWFYLKSEPSDEPVITADLGGSYFPTGDFKIQGYCANMNLSNIVIRTGDTVYYAYQETLSSLLNEAPDKQLISLNKTIHLSCTDAGDIEFSDHTYSFESSTDVLSTGLLLGRNVADFEWEFDYWSDNPSWTRERFMFHANNEGTAETDAYCLEISGINYGNGPALYKNGDYTNALGEYRWPSNLGTKTWDNAIYHVKLTVKNNLCKIWFYLKSTPAENPVITVDLGSSAPTSGDFKIQGYNSKMNLMHMKIDTGEVVYYFDREDYVNAPSKLIGDLSGNDSLDAEDFVILRKNLLGTPLSVSYTAEALDLNRDSKSNILDYVRLKKNMIWYQEYITDQSAQPLNLNVLYSRRISNGNDGWWESGVEYSRIIELQHSSSGDNGVLLSTFEELNGGQVETCGYPIYISRDSGYTWERQAFVSETVEGLSAQWNPNLFELPQQLGTLPKGTILLAGTSIGSGTANVLYQSQDSGKTWERYSTIATGGNYTQGQGIYEPFLTMLDDGTLVCYYSDELESDTHSQRVVYRTSRDGLNWSNTVEVVAASNKSYRPGMPVVARLGNGLYFMVYEMVGISNNPIYCRTSKDGLDWGDPTDIGTKIESGSNSLGSSPYCSWTPCGGEKGTLIVSACFMGSGNSETGTDYFISNDYGMSWKTMPHPIPYSTAHAKIGYSNGFCFSSDGKYLYATNNPDGDTAGHSQIRFAKVALW